MTTPTMYPRLVDDIMALETGDLEGEAAIEALQRIADSGVWTQLQGSWQRTILRAAAAGIINLAEPNGGKQ